MYSCGYASVCVRMCMRRWNSSLSPIILCLARGDSTTIIPGMFRPQQRHHLKQRLHKHVSTKKAHFDQSSMFAIFSLWNAIGLQLWRFLRHELVGGNISKSLLFCSFTFQQLGRLEIKIRKTKVMTELLREKNYKYLKVWLAEFYLFIWCQICIISKATKFMQSSPN